MFLYNSQELDTYYKYDLISAEASHTTESTALNTNTSHNLF